MLRDRIAAVPGTIVRFVVGEAIFNLPLAVALVVIGTLCWFFADATYKDFVREIIVAGLFIVNGLRFVVWCFQGGAPASPLMKVRLDFKSMWPDEDPKNWPRGL